MLLASSHKGLQLSIQVQRICNHYLKIVCSIILSSLKHSIHLVNSKYGNLGRNKLINRYVPPVVWCINSQVMCSQYWLVVGGGFSLAVEEKCLDYLILYRRSFGLISNLCMYIYYIHIRICVTYICICVNSLFSYTTKFR